MQGSEVASILAKWLRFQDIHSSSDNLAVFCPFHKGGQEEAPSMYVYVGAPTRRVQPGAAFCHTCNAGWTLPALLYKLGADRALVETVRNELKESTKPRDTLRALDLQMGELSFEQDVLPETVLAVFDYKPRALLTAGFREDIIREYDIGFDRDRRRITFAIRDHLGNLVGVSGRTVIDEEPRYKVYRSEFFPIMGSHYECEKSKVLWGLDKFYHARLHSPSHEPVVICEGFKAALWVRQAGFSDVVCLLGVALSPEQHVLLSRVATEAVLFLDNDPPGRKATWKLSRQVSDLDLRIVHYEDAEFKLSPDDLAMTTVQERVSAAPRAAEWRKRNAKSVMGGIPENPA